jgi:hypothetical protein
MLAQPEPRSKDFKWSALSLPDVDLTSLDRPFAQLPQDKAPGPDGFTGLFFKRCWPIIKLDIIAATNAFYNLRCTEFNLLNKANIVLIPKLEGAEDIRD